MESLPLPGFPVYVCNQSLNSCLSLKHVLITLTCSSAQGWHHCKQPSAVTAAWGTETVLWSEHGAGCQPQQLGTGWCWRVYACLTLGVLCLSLPNIFVFARHLWRCLVFAAWLLHWVCSCFLSVRPTQSQMKQKDLDLSIFFFLISYSSMEAKSIVPNLGVHI